MLKRNRGARGGACDGEQSALAIATYQTKLFLLSLTTPTTVWHGMILAGSVSEFRLGNEDVRCCSAAALGRDLLSNIDLWNPEPSQEGDTVELQSAFFRQVFMAEAGTSELQGHAFSSEITQSIEPEHALTQTRARHWT
jgi:hypothetical protein